MTDTVVPFPGTAVASPDGEAPAPPPGPERLKGTLGIFDLTMTVLAASAPLSVMAAFVPVSMAVGNGIGMVQSFLIAGGVLILFAFGFLAMSRRIAAEGGGAGAFYAYVARGLGRPAGLGGAFLAILAYTLLQTATYGMLGQSIVEFCQGRLGLPGFAWWQAALVCWIGVGALGYRRIDLSAKVLGIAMLGEIAVVAALDLAVVFKGGAAGGFTAAPLLPSALMSGNAAIGIMFATATFIGFEATAIYSEEVKDPRRTIPRATFLSLALITLFYSVSTYLLISAYGADAAISEANANPTTMYPSALALYVGQMAVDVMYVLLITSLFAAILSFHNAIARYFFSFGVDGVLPARFGRTHTKHGSPAAGSLLQSATAVLVVAPFALLGRDPVLELYAWGAGVGTMAMLLLMAIASISILVYLNRSPGPETLWSRRVAPVMGLVGLAAITVYASLNFEMLVGASPTLATAFLVAIYAIFVGGVLLALRWRRTRPDCYARIGRLG
ncbi:MAG: APC family permease [Cypionkella sp.]